MSSFDVIAQKAKDGDQSAIEELILLANPTSKEDLLSCSLSLRSLLHILRTQERRLQEEDRELASRIILDLADSMSFLSPSLFEYSQTPSMMNRVLLFDSELIQIRAHLFMENGEETYIHNHGQPFISTCLQGSYVHKLWSIVDEEKSMYYTHSRKTGGVYGEAVPIPGGDLQTILCQPFSEGQTLFISTEANHTISDLRGHVVTIVLRDKIKDLAESTALTKGPKLVGPSDSIVKIDDDRFKQKIFNELCEALRSFKKSLLLQPLKDHYEIKECIENIENSTNRLVCSDILRKREEYFIVGSVVAIAANWLNHGLDPTLKLRLEAILFKLVGTREVPASAEDLITFVGHSLSGRLRMIFRHLMFAISLYQHAKQGFDEDIQSELIEVVQFPAVSPNDDIFARFRKTAPWFNNVLNNPNF